MAEQALVNCLRSLAGAVHGGALRTAICRLPMHRGNKERLHVAVCRLLATATSLLAALPFDVVWTLHQPRAATHGLRAAAARPTYKTMGPANPARPGRATPRFHWGLLSYTACPGRAMRTTCVLAPSTACLEVGNQVMPACLECADFRRRGTYGSHRPWRAATVSRKHMDAGWRQAMHSLALSHC